MTDQGRAPKSQTQTVWDADHRRILRIQNLCLETGGHTSNDLFREGTPLTLCPICSQKCRKVSHTALFSTSSSRMTGVFSLPCRPLLLICPIPVLVCFGPLGPAAKEMAAVTTCETDPGSSFAKVRIAMAFQITQGWLGSIAT